MNNQNFEESSAQNSISDVVNLPDEQRQLVNWIIHQKKVTLAEVALHTNQSEEDAQNLLQSLINQGFIQELNDSASVYYQPLFSNQKKSRLSRNIWDQL
ncbi:ArsR family transcriptional regulator [Nodularia sp. UHCC 0506]|uniref:ArsR family transcriptional regulator n=1 Tax=Nodularia sp. UHCC 0506 TaxID=3110243 RepID=UPI002B21D308|nr:ArsR family transcriptional regulator [Nodularia sp. UHCC 0506]MEA5516985.1 ArsR family transcriptional regulator [Nodularia sp. UHCC 0506]